MFPANSSSFRQSKEGIGKFFIARPNSGNGICVIEQGLTILFPGRRSAILVRSTKNRGKIFLSNCWEFSTIARNDFYTPCTCSLWYKD